MTEARLSTAEENEEDEGLLAGIEPAAVLENARARAVSLVSEHPVASLFGAFALGFVLARIVKALGDD